jgi:dTDP-4-amino-4,6-dideoxygalactose transaminase
MGLCNLKYIDWIIQQRKKLTIQYDRLLNRTHKMLLRKDILYNFSYYPIILEDEKHLLHVLKVLNKENIFPRRYFYPSLNTLPYIKKFQSCPISENLSNRILCLPLFIGLKKESIKKICEAINNE